MTDDGRLSDADPAGLPIPEARWEDDWQFVQVEDNGEPLVSLRDLGHARIVVRPEYSLRGMADAIDDCLVRRAVAERLVHAADRLPTTYCIVILDGWRPVALQRALYEDFWMSVRRDNPGLTESQVHVLTRQYVSVPSSDPRSPSAHLTGGAVDVTLGDATGTVLDMGTAFDSFCEQSATSYLERSSGKLPSGGSNEEKTNRLVLRQRRRLLYHAMISAGFTNYPAEWWHYDFGNQFWALRLRCRAIYGIAQLASSTPE